MKARECPPCPFCAHERGFKLQKRRAPRLGALRHRWKCAACRKKFNAWKTTERPPEKRRAGVVEKERQSHRSDPLPAHDAPQVERYHLWASSALGQMVEADPEGKWVRYTDYATLEAETQQLEDENRRIREAVREWKDDLRAYHELDTDVELEALAEHLSVAERALLALVLTPQQEG